MLERVSERHGWWYTPREEWLERAFAEPDPDLAARLATSADRTWSYYAGDQTLAHWTDDQFKHKLLAIQRGEPTLVGWDATERDCWRCGDDLYCTTTEDLEPAAVAAMLRDTAPSVAARSSSRPVTFDVPAAAPPPEFPIAGNAATPSPSPHDSPTARDVTSHTSGAPAARDATPLAPDPPTSRDAAAATPSAPCDAPAVHDFTPAPDAPATGDAAPPPGAPTSRDGVVAAPPPDPSSAAEDSPAGSPLADIPIVRDDAAFVAGDTHWRAALAEYHAATDDEARYVALALANALLDGQLLRIHAIHAQIGARRFDDPERHAALAWAQSWSTSVDTVRLDESELLARLGRSRADALAEERVRPRLASLRRHAV